MYVMYVIFNVMWLLYVMYVIFNVMWLLYVMYVILDHVHTGHHSFGTGAEPERNRAPVFTSVPLCPVVPERADHLAMWSQWNGSGTGPVGSVVWTHNRTRSGRNSLAHVS